MSCGKTAEGTPEAGAAQSGKAEIKVHAGRDPAANGRALQKAIDRANPGATIILDAGGNYWGPITLPAKAGDGPPITIQTSALSKLPPAGERIGPQHASSWQKSSRRHADLLALYTADGADHYTLLGLEFTSTAATNVEYAYVHFGNDGAVGLYSVPQTTAAQVPHDLVLDRCYIHGLPGQDSRASVRGISLHSASTRIEGC